MVLSLASLVTKVLSAIYKVPFQNLTGDQGFYVYQQIYPFYGLAQTLAITGIPLFVSKISSEPINELDRQIKLRQLFSWLASLFLACFFVLRFFSQSIASFMGDPKLTPVLQSVSYMYLILPLTGFLRGTFQGQMNMIPTGVSQVIEQVVRVGILLLVASCYYITRGDLYQMGTWAMTSTWLAALVALAVLVAFSGQSSRSLLKLLKPIGLNPAIGKRLLVEGSSLLVASSLMILMQFIDSFTVFNGLIAQGLSQGQAMVEKGIYDRGFPFIQVGLVIGISVATSLLPYLRKYYNQNEKKRWTKLTSSLFRLTILLAWACSLGLILVMPWLNRVLFEDFAKIHVLQVLMLSILPASLIFCTQSVIQSGDSNHKSILIVAFGLALKLLINPIAVRYFGVLGSAFLTLVSLNIIFILMAAYLPKAVLRDLNSRQFFWKLFIASLAMALSLGGLVLLVLQLGFSPFEFSRVASLIFLLLLSFVGAFIYLGCLINFDALSEEELAQLPKSYILKKLRWNRS